MKRLIFSDVHFNCWGYGATITKDGYNSRLWQQYQAAREMIRDIEKYNVKYVYFCGDLFHRHGSIQTEALSVASLIFDEIKREYDATVSAITGNHDQYNKKGSIHSLSWLDPLDVYDSEGYSNNTDIRMHALSYTKDEDTIKQFLENAGNGGGGMALLHQGVAGIPLASGYMLDERLTPEMIPENLHVFTGHYHFHKQISPNLTVVGNLTPLNWGDIDQEKGWLIWDDETNEIIWRKQTQSPNFLSYNEESEVPIEGNFLRYTRQVDPKEQADIRAKLIKEGALAVEFPRIKTEKKRGTIRSGDEVTIEHIVKTFDEQNEGRRKDIGIEIREEQYEAPTT